MPLPKNDVTDLPPPPLSSADTGTGMPPPPPYTAPQADDASSPQADADLPSPPPQATAESENTEQTDGGAPPAPFSVSPAKADSTALEKTRPNEGLGQASTAHAIATEAAELGFEGVDLSGFGTFPIVSLQKETFKTNDGDILGASFRGYCRGSRKKFIYKNGLANENPEATFFYTYDDELTIRGESIADILAEWRNKGWSYIKNPYVELFIEIEGGEKHGHTVALSIPKTSIKRFSNFYMRLRGKGVEEMTTTLCEFGQGKEVTGPRIKNPWIPLDFKILS